MRNTYLWNMDSWGSDFPPENADEIINTANMVLRAYAKDHDDEECYGLSEKMWDLYCENEKVIVPLSVLQAIDDPDHAVYAAIGGLTGTSLFD